MSDADAPRPSTADAPADVSSTRDADSRPAPTTGASGAPPADAGDPALGRAAEILRAAGTRFRALSRRGFSGDVLAVEADPGELGRIRACAPQVRGLGLRYVALELWTEEPSIARPDGTSVSGEPATRLT